MSLNIKYIDTHAHLHFRQFDEDREEVLERMRAEAVSAIVVGTCLETSKLSVELARSFATRDVILGATIGVHPTDTNENFDTDNYKKLLCKEVVGVGECGFDYFRTPRKEVYSRQREVFERQIIFSVEHNLPLMLHIRPSQGSTDAHEDTLEILTTYQKSYDNKLRGTTHFFTGSAEVALKYVELGFYISFPGVITFAPETHKALCATPLENILVETDAPYASPTPYRGERNEPVYVMEILKKIAEIKNIPYEEARVQILQNSLNLFAIHS